MELVSQGVYIYAPLQSSHRPGESVGVDESSITHRKSSCACNRHAQQKHPTNASGAAPDSHLCAYLPPCLCLSHGQRQGVGCSWGEAEARAQLRLSRPRSSDLVSRAPNQVRFLTLASSLLRPAVRSVLLQLLLTPTSNPPHHPTNTHTYCMHA